MMKNYYKFLITGCLLSAILTNGCQSQTEMINPSQTLTYGITPYATSTQTNTLDRSTPISTVTKEGSIIPTLTPTPFLYQVEKNDTFTSIAYEHGIKLKELISANPQIDPNFLTIGITITVPISENLTTLLLVPTPIPLELETTSCYQDSLGKLTCFVLVKNNQQFDIENLSASITLESDKTSCTQSAFSPLNFVPAGSSIPLVAEFQPPIPDYYEISSSLESAIPIHTDDQRYLSLELSSQSITISENLLQAIVSGEVTLTNDDQEAEHLWIIGIGYDSNGKPVGYRKWESYMPLVSGETMVFSFIVYSFNSPIDTVEILTEAGQ